MRNIKLKDVSTILTGGTPSTSVESYWNNEIEWFTPTEIGKKKYITSSERKISKLGLSKSSAKIIRANSIILSTRATIGEISINTIECATNQGCQAIQVNENVDSEYLFYRLTVLKEKLIALSSGSTFLELSNSQLSNISFDVHNFNDQIKIAGIFSTMDKLVGMYLKRGLV